MKKVILRCMATVLAAVLFVAPSTISAAGLTPALAIASDAYIVVDAASGQVLIEKNMHKRKAPASITKILTLALALEKGGVMDDVITVSKPAIAAVEAGSTHIALEVGEKITFRDAVMGTQLISANDAANVAAEYISGSMEAFVAGMNAKVSELGLGESHFANPNGLDANGHYVTAYDMAQITRYALGVPGFREIFAQTEYQMAPTNKKARNYKFTAQNPFILPYRSEHYEGITGGKLGYTYNANHTLVASAKRGNMELIVVTLDSGNSAKFKDAKLLLDYCFERYETMTLSGKELRADDVPVASIENPTAMVSFSSGGEHTFAVPLGTAKSSLQIRYNIPELYKSERTVEPTFTVCTAGGQELYTAKLEFSISPVDRMVSTPTVSNVPKDYAKYFSDMMLVAFKCLLVGLSVFAVLFFVCRSVVMVRYAVRKKRAYRKKLELVKRRQLALQRSAAEIRQLEAELGMQLPSIHPAQPSHVPNNVTRIYPGQGSTARPQAHRNTGTRK